jgi:hypothetical protein
MAGASQLPTGLASTTTARALATSATFTSTAAWSSTKSATRSAALSQPSLVNADCATFKVGLVEFLDSAGALIGIRHLDARLAGQFIDHDDGTLDLAGL